MQRVGAAGAIVARALAELDPAARVARALPTSPRPPARLAEGSRSAEGSVRLVAVGKAAEAMAEGARARWGDAITEALVVTPESARSARRRRRTTATPVTILHAGHPLPDARSVQAGARALEIANRAGEHGDLLLVLVSGGASALVCGLPPGVRLADKVAVTRAMLESGAPIQEINVVRKHLSTIKGGGLAHAAGPAQVLTLVLSDIVAPRGDPADVGSGPSLPDASTRAAARRLLRRYTGARFDRLPLVTAVPVPNAARPKVIASPEELGRVVRRQLQAEGLAVRLLPPSQGAVTSLAEEYLRFALRLRPGQAVVRVAEPAVVVRASGRAVRRGRGGRSTHLAALVGRSIPEGLLFIAAATDGVDGTSGTAGAVVDASFREIGLTAIDVALARFDTGPLHVRAGTALPSLATGHNLADLHILLREAPPG